MLPGMTQIIKGIRYQLSTELASHTNQHAEIVK
jgi:hypothetical protein